MSVPADVWSGEINKDSCRHENGGGKSYGENSKKQQEMQQTAVLTTYTDWREECPSERLFPLDCSIF